MNRRFKFPLVFCAFILAWFFLAWIAAESLIVEKPLNKADAILVLSGSSAYIERTRKAVELYNQGVAPRIFLTDDGERSSWSRVQRNNPQFVELARKNLIENGVPIEAIEILPETVDGTKSEADALQKKVNKTRLNSILLVTSAYHTRRALRTFEKTFAENNRKIEIGIESVSPGNKTPKSFLWWLSVKGWRFVAGEYVKSVYYWVYY
ncbi:MAG TPA: YdcF family protein [Pyrinomonadaceae bacterium]|nr:YdcF family protein [Pyrinomonadaceae bacterium]